MLQVFPFQCVGIAEDSSRLLEWDAVLLVVLQGLPCVPGRTYFCIYANCVIQSSRLTPGDTGRKARVAKTLGITQASVSRLEKRSDLLLSIRRKTVKALGVGVRIVAEFPDRAPVVLSGLSEDDPPRKSSLRHVHAHT